MKWDKREFDVEALTETMGCKEKKLQHGHENQSIKYHAHTGALKKQGLKTSVPTTNLKLLNIQNLC